MSDPAVVGPWAVTITSRLFVGVAAFVIVAAGAVTLIPIWDEPIRTGSSAVAIVSTVVILTAVLVFVLAFVRIHVTVDERGLRVVSWLGIRIKAIPLKAIESVFADDLVPMQWGGWGYRIMPGRSALILGTGPGLVVQLTSGNQFAISLPDPETPADLLVARLNLSDGPRAG
ncbi:hypothetical protein GY21_06520 [Cryobacterium roopkundense]|uniref:Bacterial Pleckstrin homology domain-containing protein n=1 Tax=Cryobacterium roopkundense TaxID=1001240 RepID=A0A099JKF3_9MICO|nr:hypothetical protein [Cryobacterium roopkundense]KGJ78575.1 hypothetical protein GY21_06520 [Cryobacterium roopkundense]MBB5641268.1 hypothetical protein [Cryobacterium roopkundense]